MRPAVSIFDNQVQLICLRVAINGFKELPNLFANNSYLQTEIVTFLESLLPPVQWHFSSSALALFTVTQVYPLFVDIHNTAFGTILDFFLWSGNNVNCMLTILLSYHIYV
jgi:hypothetical protein